MRKSEAEPEQLVLLFDRPVTGEAEPLPQPQHGFEPLNGSPGRVEALKAADPRHVLLQSKNGRSQSGKITVPHPKSQYGGTAAEAAASGRDGLLGFIDEQYRNNCIDNENGAKLC